MDLGTLEKREGDQWRVASRSSTAGLYRLCANGTQYQVCNWMVPVQGAHSLCEACRLNQVIPDLSFAGNLDRWRKFENAKRRVWYTIKNLGLETDATKSGATPPLRFSFLADTPEGPRVIIGHSNGLITLAVAEADDDVREKRRVALKEVYRTLLGHIRHEIAHYYWALLIESSPWRPPFRELFGDDTADYSGALQSYYTQGPPPDWNLHHVSAYASAHPWEDWAETFAHYLHIRDMVETGSSFGLSLQPRHPAAPAMSTDLKNIDDASQSFDCIVTAWFPLTFALNEINRGMGLPDIYPFVLSGLALKKLRFVHDVIQDYASH